MHCKHRVSKPIGPSNRGNTLHEPLWHVTTSLDIYRSQGKECHQRIARASWGLQGLRPLAPTRGATTCLSSRGQGSTCSLVVLAGPAALAPTRGNTFQIGVMGVA